MSTADAPKKPRETDDVPVPATLRKSLKNRHIQLIALGGAIGTGLFYGSSESIALAGPSILLAYLIGGLIIFLIVRALSEMAVEGELLVPEHPQMGFGGRVPGGDRRIEPDGRQQVR